jgi:hypothetical protein
VPIYYNWIPGQGEPTKSFTSLEEAEEEAKRLNAKHPNKRVFTLQQVLMQPSKKDKEKELIQEVLFSGLLSDSLYNRLHEFCKNNYKE